MGYREDLEAAQARADALQRNLDARDRELAEARAEIDRLRADPVDSVRLVLLTTERVGQVFPLTSERVTIGRIAGDDGDIAIPDASLSRRHAQLVHTPDGYTIEDLGSANGVSVNGARVHAPVLLRGGERLSLGSVLFQVLAPSEDAPQALPDLRVYPLKARDHNTKAAMLAVGIAIFITMLVVFLVFAM